jgi:hypothetical protein
MPADAGGRLTAADCSSFPAHGLGADFLHAGGCINAALSTILRKAAASGGAHPTS